MWEWYSEAPFHRSFVLLHLACGLEFGSFYFSMLCAIPILYWFVANFSCASVRKVVTGYGWCYISLKSSFTCLFSFSPCFDHLLTICSLFLFCLSCILKLCLWRKKNQINLKFHYKHISKNVNTYTACNTTKTTSSMFKCQNSYSSA